MDEPLDILDPSGRPTGEVAQKSRAHREGLWHRCFHLWVCDPAGPYLLVQRRAAAKDTWPGYLDVTVAGHLSAGERPADGVREAEEELGLVVDPARLLPLGTRRIDQRIPAGHDREFHDVFLLLDGTPPERMRLQPEEVEAVLRLRLEDAERLDAGEAVPAEWWSADGRGTSPVSLADFVPKGEGVVSLVAAAARRAMAGEAPDPVFRP